MKYHVNPDTGKVSACRAKVKCRFGGATGAENHFGTKPAAETAAEKLMSSRYVATAGKSKGTFAAVKQNIQAGLVRSNIIKDASELPPVKNQVEMIDKWFGGDERKFEFVSRLSDPKSKLTNTTKQSMGRLVASGADVSIASAGSFDRAPSDSVSDVELIDEMPQGNPSVKEMSKGSSKPF